MHGLAWFISFALLAGVFINLTPCLFENISPRINAITFKLKNRLHQRLIAGLLVVIGCTITIALLTTPIACLSDMYPAFFQSRLFLTSLSGILLLSGLLTFFKIKLPTRKNTEKFKAQGFKGAFVTGLLLLFLAFPNSGWFLLSVFIFSIVLPVKIILCLFASLSAGLTLPLFIFLLSPKLVLYLNKLEKWSTQSIKILAFALLVGGVFFSSAFIPAEYHFWIQKVLEVSIVVWALFHLVRNKNIINRVIPIFVLALYAFFNFTLPQSSSLALKVQYSEKYSQYARTQYRPVLIIFTADWCLNCKLLEKTVYKHPHVFQLAKKTNLIPLIVDMTHPTEKNRELFKKYGGKLLPYAVLIDTNGNIKKQLPGMFNIIFLLKALQRL